MLDVICSTIEDRFRQSRFQLYSDLEQLLLKAGIKENYSAEFDFVTTQYDSHLNANALQLQLEVFRNDYLTQGENASLTFRDILKYLKSLSSVEKLFLSDVCVVTKLILVMPATNAVSERSVSTSGDVKIYLQSTVNQSRF